MTPDLDLTAVGDLIAEVAAVEVKDKLGQISRAEITEKSAGDFVTSADLAVEKRLGEAFKDILPEAEVLGEEAVAAGTASIDSLADDVLHWVIDPIDGTGNFAMGLPLCAVIVSLIRKDEVIAGWIHDPFSNRTFIGSHGAGAWFGDRRLSCHRPDDLRLMNGSIYGRRFRERSEFRELWAQGRRHLGAVFNARCVGHEHMARLAGLGHFGCYSRLLPWDHAAGFLLHGEAGGVGRLINGQAYKPSDPSIPGLLAPDEDVWRMLEEVLVGDGSSPS
jgi:fructose-1,6-bisphosphatase/inositol monophosphatase family enzyme